MFRGGIQSGKDDLRVSPVLAPFFTFWVRPSVRSSRAVDRFIFVVRTMWGMSPFPFRAKAASV